jgi:methyl-accepting chemotaxis protein
MNFHRTRQMLARLSVGAQLGLTLAVVMAFAAISSSISLYSLHKLSENATEIDDKWLAGFKHVTAARAAAISLRDFEVKHSRATDKSYHAEYEDHMTASAEAFDKAIAAYDKLVAGDDEKTLVGAIASASQAYRATQQRVIALGREGKQQDAADISDGAASLQIDELLGALTTLADRGSNGADAAAAAAQELVREGRALVLGLLALGLVVGAGMVWLVTRQLLRQLGGEPRVAVRLAKAVASGDLTTEISLRTGDTTSLLASLQDMQASLAQAVQTVREGAESVAMGSTQIADGNTDLSSRTEQQSGALQETAATMEELGTTVSSNADSAGQAHQLARAACDVAQQAGDTVTRVVQTMESIRESSRRIADITSVIDSIAFQTNILALNAAVEAARAGEQGRGFAVVAAEVRNLAKNSAQSAKDIKALIDTSVMQVSSGSDLAQKAGATMSDVVTSTQRVTDLIGHISAASHEQSTSVGQVAQAVTQMDQMTQQNAALVEESAAAASSLKQQAQQLLQAVSVFTLDHGAAQLATPAPASVPASRLTQRPAELKAHAARPVARAGKPAKHAHARADTDNAEWTSF